MDQPEDSARRFTPGQTGLASPLGSLEQSVMGVLWKRSDPANVSDVQAAVPEAAYTTVKTTLERLTRKGILTRIRDGKAYLYRAAVTQEELERRIVAETMDKLVSRFPGAVVSYFTTSGNTLSDETAALLQEAIERRRREENEGR